MLNNIWDEEWHEWLESKAVGLSGGLLCLWDKKLFQLSSSQSSRNWIWCSMVNIADQKPFHVLNIYGPQDLDQRKKLWKDLTDIPNKIGLEEGCLIGDFNCIRVILRDQTVVIGE
ncbi:hypothetical protein POM88_030393 [Heracleum sosnowskyi]|uniref:Uncharacterized protein n=1 Tax=Heracleum sosnowskyi TaxID=360622 RepID=A0AAD8HYG7_9APIA|nr:hypothetical protein POM88_030393 [Heracleum sosnowskyi]